MTESVDPFIKLLSTPIPDTLWHYTSLQGFQGIITSKCIWATDIRYLNDTAEYRNGHDMAKDLLRKKISEDGGDNALVQILSMVLEQLVNPEMRLYVTSFSTKRDQLSQWRGYSSGGCGLSIGFDLRGARPSQQDSLSCLAPCIYDDIDKMHLLKAAFSEMEEELKQIFEEIDTTVTDAKVSHHNEADFTLKWAAKALDAAGRTAAKLLRVAALAKHHSFYEESEWRLVLPTWPDPTKVRFCRKFRVAQSSLIPYVAFPLPNDGDGKWPLREVVVGPTQEPFLAKDAAASFLECRGIVCDSICNTDIPFRLW